MSAYKGIAEKMEAKYGSGKPTSGAAPSGTRSEEQKKKRSNSTMKHGAYRGISERMDAKYGSSEPVLDKYSAEEIEEMARSVSDWTDKYNSTITKIKSYSLARKGKYTKDASGGFDAQLDELLTEYEGIKDYAEQF